MDDNEDEAERGQRVKLRGYIDRLPSAGVNSSALGEILYTANETGLLEFGVSFEDALFIWKLVELGRGALADVDLKTMVSEIRM